MIKDYLNDKLGYGRDAGADTIYPCLFCGHMKLYIVTDYASSYFGVFHCFHCGCKGRLPSIIAKLNGISYEQAVTELTKIDSLTTSGQYYNVDGLSPEESTLAFIVDKKVIGAKHKQVDLLADLTEKKMPPTLPDGLHYLDKDYNLPQAQPFIAYLARRGFGKYEIDKYHIGYIRYGGTYSKAGNYIPIINHVVFFAYDKHGKYLYWNTRAIYKADPKSINAPELDGTIGKGDIVYNLYQAIHRKNIILTEGVPDAMTLGGNGIATYGKGVTDKQKSLILRHICPEQRLILMLDMDAYQAMVNLAEELYNYHKETYMVFNPTNRDANSLGKKEALKIIRYGMIKANSFGVDQFLVGCA